MHMNGHCGWVRCLASSGKYLFSCGCNILHQVGAGALGGAGCQNGVMLLVLCRAPD